MLEFRSALENATPFTSPVLTIGEDRDFSLTQLAWFEKVDEKELAETLGKLPKQIGVAHASDQVTVMRIAPRQIWRIANGNEGVAPTFSNNILVTALSSSRTRIVVDGARARAVLAYCAPIDFHLSVFKPRMFAMTGIHHTPVLIHCVGDNRFEIYALRTFALSVHDWLTDAALVFAGH